MFATPGTILPEICDWVLHKNYESHRVKALQSGIKREKVELRRS